MKKKFLLLIGITFLLCGCNAKYELEIKDEKIKESFFVSETDLLRAGIKDDMESSFKDYALLYGENSDIYTNYYSVFADRDEGELCKMTEDEDCSIYEKEFIDTSEEVGFKLNHVFSFKEYENATIPMELFPDFRAEYDKQRLTIRLGNNMSFLKSYDGLEKVDFVIKTNYNILNTNAKHIGNGVYMWSFDQETGQALMSPYIIIDTSRKMTTKNENLGLIVTILSIIILIVVVFLFVNLYKKYKANNQT